MSRYDGLIIPRSYSEYINKTDAATLQQAMQLSGVLSGTVADGDNKAVKSDAVAKYNYNSISQSNGVYVQRYGKVVSLILYIPMNRQINSHEDLANYIPAGYRPKINLYIMAQNESTKNNLEIGVFANGTIRIYAPKQVETITNLMAEITYMI